VHLDWGRSPENGQRLLRQIKLTCRPCQQVRRLGYPMPFSRKALLSSLRLWRPSSP
jgi:hypothetical protein